MKPVLGRGVDSQYAPTRRVRREVTEADWLEGWRGHGPTRKEKLAPAEEEILQYLVVMHPAGSEQWVSSVIFTSRITGQVKEGFLAGRRVVDVERWVCILELPTNHLNSLTSRGRSAEIEDPGREICKHHKDG